MKEVNILIKERDELLKWSVKFNNENKNYYEYGQKQLFFLCETTKQAYSVRKSTFLQNVINIIFKLYTYVVT